MSRHDSEVLQARQVHEKYCCYLYNAARAMAIASNEPAVLSLLSEKAVEALGVKACSIRLLDERGEELELASASGLSDRYLGKGPVRVEESRVDGEALEGRAVVIEDVTRDPRWQYPVEAEREGIRSVLCVPLTVKGRNLGTMRVYSAEPRRFDEETVSLLTVLSNYAAIAIKNSRLYELALKNWRELVEEHMGETDYWGTPV